MTRRSAARRALLPPVLAALAVALGSCGTASDDPTGAATGRATTPATSGEPSRVLNGGVGDGAPGRRSYAPWPAAGHDAAHTGATTVLGPQRGQVRWRRRLEGAVVPGPVVGNGGIAYAASNGGILHALRVESGREVWSFDGGGGYGSDLSTSPLLTPSGELIWPGPDGQLFGISAQTGRLRWQVDLGAPGLSPALAAGGDVIVGTTAGTVRSLKLRGALPPTTNWAVETGSVSYGSPVVAADGTVYTTVDNSLVAIRRGVVRWRVDSEGLVEVGAAIGSDGTIVFGSNDRRVYGVSTSGRIRWRYRLGDLTYSSPSATHDGLVYIGDHFGRVTALAVSNGRPRLVVKGAGRTPGHLNVGVWSAPAIDAAHNVYFGSHPGHVYGFDRYGNRLFDVDTGALSASYPALAGDGTLLIGNDAGDLLAIR